jgi:hypothetical protein
MILIEGQTEKQRDRWKQRHVIGNRERADRKGKRREREREKEWDRQTLVEA